MENEAFQKIVESLATLSEAELLELEKVVWDRKLEALRDARFAQRDFSAKAIFSRQKVAGLSFGTIKQGIGDLNPAECYVIYELINFHCDKKQSHEGQMVSHTWKMDRNFRMRTGIVGITRGDYGSSGSPSPELQAQTLQAFQELTHLISQAGKAKETGNPEQVSELVERAIQLAEKVGLPSSMIQRMKESYLQK